MANLVRTGILIAALTALFMAIGHWIGGAQGMIIALIIAGAMNAFTYWSADRVVLAMQGARELREAEAPELIRLVGELAKRANLPMPRLYLIESEQPNAFATGRNPEHAALAVTRGLLETLPKRELAGVLSHELAHVKHYDTLTMTITATLAGAIGMLANFLLFFSGGRNSEHDRGMGAIGALVVMLIAPLAATLVQLAISRTREFAADAGGATISGDPMALAQALARIHEGAARIPNTAAERNPASAHLFIVNPLRGGHLDGLFSTHPPVEERIARLHAMAEALRRRSPWGVRNG